MRHKFGQRAVLRFTMSSRRKLPVCITVCLTILAAIRHEILRRSFVLMRFQWSSRTFECGTLLALRCGMLESSTLFSHSSPSYPPYLGNAGFPQPGASVSVPLAEQGSGTFAALSRRLRRELRRRKVGRAYDMALEIARIIPNAYEILDVGCGNGYIAQHLAGLLGSYVLGIDVDGAPEAPINFRRFDGEDVPASDHSFEAVLFCYVLHHAQDVSVLLSEARRVLRNDGVVVVYEDIPSTRWDQFICSIHNLKWRGRTGECTFRSEAGWRETFAGAGFEIVQQRTLSRWRKLVHPVRRHLFLLRLNQSTTR